MSRYNLFIAPFVAGWGLYMVSQGTWAGWFIVLGGTINWAIGCGGKS